MNIKPIAILFINFLIFVHVLQVCAQNKDFSNSINSYSFDLYRESIKENENLLLSPLSTYNVLLMAYEGAKEETKQEFEKVLYLGPSKSVKQNYFYNFANDSDCCGGFEMNNAVWLDKYLNIEPEYKTSVSEKYFSDFKQTDFSNPASAISAINQWVSDNTNGRITEIVNDANVTSETRLLLANSVYFKGEWLEKFDKRHTHSATFFASAENQYKVDFMKKREILRYYENSDFQFISKPYQSSNLSFCILLPKKLFDIEVIEKKLSNDFLNSVLDSTYFINTSVTIPKLKLEFETELSEALKKAGLKSAFTTNADFSGITKEIPLKLEQVVHKTWIELDEEKTEAAAATAAPVMIGSAGIASFKIFNADHPFIFFIIDNSTRAIIFMGRYVEPAQGQKIEVSRESLAVNLVNRKGENFDSGKPGMGILYVVNEQIISSDEFKLINPTNIESVHVIKKREDINKYSAENYDGVIVVKTKK
jgi:serpin B